MIEAGLDDCQDVMDLALRLSIRCVDVLFSAPKFEYGDVVVLGWRYTNTPGSTKDQVMATLDGGSLRLASPNTRPSPRRW